MAGWRFKRYDDRGVVDLGPVVGRLGPKQLRQAVQGMAVRAGFPGLTEGRLSPVSASMRAALEERIKEGSVVAHEADGILFTAERS